MNVAIETEIIEKKKAVVVEQKPIIKYNALEQISKEVIAKIESLAIDKIEANEDTLKYVKNTRTELKKEFTTLEDQRKMVKEIVLKDYNDFEDAYKRLIATHYKNADLKIRDLVGTVEDKILQKKINNIKEYFESVNTFEFINFEDLQLKIIKSRSDKSIKDEIDMYLDAVSHNIETISTLAYADRVLAKYQISKDLNSSISKTNIEIQREEDIKKQNEEHDRLNKEREEQRSLESSQQARQAKNDALYTPEHDAEIEDSPILEHTYTQDAETAQEQVFKTNFTIRGTKQQLSELKAYMIEKGIEIL